MTVSIFYNYEKLQSESFDSGWNQLQFAQCVYQKLERYRCQQQAHDPFGEL